MISQKKPDRFIPLPQFVPLFIGVLGTKYNPYLRSAVQNLINLKNPFISKRRGLHFSTLQDEVFDLYAYTLPYVEI